MDEQIADRFVAAVASIVGSVLLWAAWRQPLWWRDLPKIRWMERRWGSGPARLVSAAAGLGLWVLAGVILSGWRMSW